MSDAPVPAEEAGEPHSSHGTAGGPGAPDSSVETSGVSPDDQAWEKFIEQLKLRGPGHTRYVGKGALAHGGMGVVQRVYDSDLRRSLAMKVMLGWSEGQPGEKTTALETRSLGRFLEEAQVTGQLDHPGIIPIHELGVDAEGQVYFTMKLVNGEDLRSVFDRLQDPDEEDWNETRALNVLLRVCEAMAYAHAKGVIHRDLKPANVMVGKYGEVYVMDWGLARVLGQDDQKDMRLRSPADQTTMVTREKLREMASAASDSPLITMDGDVVGTPAYMPPEQAEGNMTEVGPHSDVYAIGAMLYHLLTGRMPYLKPGYAVSPHALLAMALEGPPRPVHDLRRDCPAELQAICDKAMARSIPKRYPDMVSLARDLRAYLENRVVEAYESGPIAELKKWMIRNKAVASTAAAALIAVLALSVWALAEQKSAKENAADAMRNEQLARAKEQEAIRERDRADRNAAQATRESRRADARAAEAVSRKQEFDQLAGVVRLRNAKARIGELYPPWPQRIPAMNAWLSEDAAQLIALQPTLRRTLDDLENRALPLSGVDSSSSSAANRDSPGRGRYLLANGSLQFLYDTLSELSEQVSAFESDEKVRVEKLRAWASRIEELTVAHPTAPHTWDEARAAIAAADGKRASELYGNHHTDLTPQLGLVPIGMNPVTGLWEFYHLRSAYDPKSDSDPAAISIPRHQEDGSLDIQENTGIVFVLIPGGTYRLGAQSSHADQAHFDAGAQGHESPVHVQALEPFFLSRYELTQGQWLRLTGTNPSFFGPHHFETQWNVDGRPADLTHPVEKISWHDCMLHLGRFGLRLPSEAQWEAACRATTDSPWWTGSSILTLDDACNLLDNHAHSHGSPEHPEWERELDDGNTVPTRVSSYRANPFGLHDVTGNLLEWCLDQYGGYSTKGRDGDGARLPTDGSPTRIIRGGSYNSPATHARSAFRYAIEPDYRHDGVGCRPARNLRND